MTATLPTRYQSIRTFGFEKAEMIWPKGKAGAAQKLFVFGKVKADESIYDEVRKLAGPRKACIIVPSGGSAEKWKDYAELYDSEVGHAAIKAFKSEESPKKIILAALYDGIDLPGRSCNVLILDGIPRGSNLHDQFLEESLDVKSLRASNVAARTTQSIGRIFRSNTDHGVVILADKGQQSWLMDPGNLAFIPYMLQQQIRLGLAIRRLVDEGKLDYTYLMEAAINGKEDWDTFYNRETAKLEAEQKPKETKWGEAAARNEYAAFREMWEGRFESAAKILSSLAVEAETHDPASAAWYLHWIGVAYLHAEKMPDAKAFFWQASNKKLSLGRPPEKSKVEEKNLEPGPQAINLKDRVGSELRKVIDTIIVALKGDGGKNAEDHENAIKMLGECLGFIGRRPDAEEDKGPDVVWYLSGLKVAVAIEAKTQKESPKLYKKNKHIGKIHNDCEWFDQAFPGYERRLALIGPAVGIAPQASPPQDLRVMQMSELINLAVRLGTAIQNAVARMDSKTPAVVAVQSAFDHYGLLWPDCIDALNYTLAVDLQEEDDSEES